MTHATAGLRATSFVAAAGLMGLATIAALTMTLQLAPSEPFGAAAPVVVIRPEPAPPPQQPEPVRTPRQNPVRETPFAEAPRVFDDEAPPTYTDDQPVLGPMGPVEITNPRWLQRPRSLAHYYPRRALQMGMEGEVILDCRVSTVGALDCTVARETPPNWGFGEAAVRIARDHRMAPATRDGQAVEARHRMRVPFNLD